MLIWTLFSRLPASAVIDYVTAVSLLLTESLQMQLLSKSMLFPNCNNRNKAAASTDNVKNQHGYRTCCSYCNSKSLTTDSDYKGSWHWVSQTCFLSIRQTTGYITIFSKLQYDIVVRDRIILHPLMSAQAWFRHFSFYCGITESEVSQLPDRSVS